MTAPAWTARQRHFAATLLDPQSSPPDFLETHNGAAVATRLDVYRNNVHTSLIDALLAVFPVTARLVSEESFRALACGFLRHELPQHAALHDYGAGLPAYLAGQAASTSPPYLPDVAALEHAWWQSCGAADAPTLSLRELATADGAALLQRRARMHPATRLLDSDHPVQGIWLAHQCAGEPAPPGLWQPESVLITRPGLQVQVRRITTAQHVLLSALASGETLQCAATAAIERDPEFDLGAALLTTIEAGAIQELAP